MPSVKGPRRLQPETRMRTSSWQAADEQKLPARRSQQTCPGRKWRQQCIHLKRQPRLSPENVQNHGPPHQVKEWPGRGPKQQPLQQPDKDLTSASTSAGTLQRCLAKSQPVSQMGPLRSFFESMGMSAAGGAMDLFGKSAGREHCVPVWCRGK